MTTSLHSPTTYTQFVFELITNRASIDHHSLVVFTISPTVAIVRGEIVFRAGHTLRVFEQIDFLHHRIIKYSYEVEHNGERLWWYDMMPHPDVAELQSTHPHHKHLPPDIKHHRIPAPGLSFDKPNLNYLVIEIESQIGS
ncbi:MAG: hypothetical protein HZC40_23940 [Chloroflexi bacterium]|nr:hypothetical protein [Chloroflexota bacterium]